MIFIKNLLTGNFEKVELQPVDLSIVHFLKMYLWSFDVLLKKIKLNFNERDFNTIAFKRISHLNEDTQKVLLLLHSSSNILGDEAFNYIDISITLCEDDIFLKEHKIESLRAMAILLEELLIFANENGLLSPLFEELEDFLYIE